MIFDGHFRAVVVTLCAQVTHDQLAIAKFLVITDEFHIVSRECFDNSRYYADR